IDSFVFFFFQAEDGIRDLYVTGVQTCTLPISMKCTVDQGHFIVESGLVDWSLDRSSAQRIDSWTFGDLLIRYGATPDMEVQLGRSEERRVGKECRARWSP